MFAIHRFARLAVLAVALAPSAGCVAFYGYRDVRVTVHDAETGRPIPGARVEVKYGNMLFTLNSPWVAPAFTGPDGTAAVRAPVIGHEVWTAEADGFISAIDRSQRETAVAFRVYRAPEPQVEVIVRNGYRGPLLIDRRPVPQPVPAEAVRRFTFRAAPSGLVAFDATPLLMKMRTSINYRYEDGTPVPEPDGDHAAIALRWISRDDARTLLVIGTLSDAQAMSDRVTEPVPAEPGFVTLRGAKFRALFDDAIRE